MKERDNLKALTTHPFDILETNILILATMKLLTIQLIYIKYRLQTIPKERWNSQHNSFQI